MAKKKKNSIKPVQADNRIKFKSTDISENCLHLHHLSSDMTEHPAHLDYISAQACWLVTGHKPTGFMDEVHRSLHFTLIQTGYLYCLFQQINYGLLC